MGKKKKSDEPISVFIRHNQKASLFKKDPGLLDKLCAEKRIAICFGNKKNKESKKAKDRKEKSALKTLEDCCKKGAIVCAEYSKDDGKKQVLVGKINKGQKIEKAKIRGKYQGNPYINRTLKLSNVNQYTAYKGLPFYGMLLSSLRPRGTIMTWHCAEKQLKAIFDNKPLEPGVDNLAPRQLEVLCYEWLRKYHGLDALLLPIGGTMEAVDIWGIDKRGRHIYAQVTHEEDADQIGKKVKRLFIECDLKNSVLFFFGPRTKLEEFEKQQYNSLKKSSLLKKLIATVVRKPSLVRKSSDGKLPQINYIPIETVFKKFKKSKMRKAMFP